MAVPVFEVGPVDQNIVYSFIVGFVIAWIIFGIRILVIKARSRVSIRDLKTSLANRIDIETSAINNMKKEIGDLKTKNANLRTSMQNLSAKPGRREKLQLEVYQSAIEKMSVRAPGFAPAWHIVLKECEEEAGRSLDGTIPFIKRIVPTVGTGWASAQQLPAGSADISSDSELSGRSRTSRSRKPSLLQRITGKNKSAG